MKVLEELKVTEPKTKAAAKLLKDLGLSGKGLIILEKDNGSFWKAARNLKGVQLTLAQELNIFDLLQAKWILTEKGAVSRLEEGLI